LSLSLRAGCEPRCPGCKHRELDADESEARKLQWLRGALAEWRDALEPVRGIRGEARWNYRERATLRTEWDGARWHAGLRLLRGPRDYELLPIPGCPVHSARARRWIEALCRALPGPEAGVSLAYLSVSGGLVTLVLKQRELTPSVAAALEGACASAAPDAVGVLAHLNASTGNRVFGGKDWRLVRGAERDRAGVGVHGPRSFAQLIPELYAGALDEAHGFLRPASGVRVVDLCSGIGASLARWVASGANAIGVELEGEAVECASENASGGPGHAEVLRGLASDRIPQVAAWLGGRDCVAFVNPPRLGLEPEVTRWLSSEARPTRLAYLSCSAGTLARDLSVFSGSGYSVRRIIPYDFFPQTHHVETLALLER
jgi:tRNA/tmRNA/rRNA uracil-C5-methylase (TrmA/RlmC/RlmD family)